MRIKALLLLPLLAAVLASCSNGEEEIKKLYPQKVVIGSTTHDFYYDQGRIYSVTTNRPNFYEEVTYTYFDEHLKKPDALHKDKIFGVNWEPDAGSIGWDKSDSIIAKREMLIRSDETGLLVREYHNFHSAKNRQGTYNRDFNRHFVKHQYNSDNQLSESNYYYSNKSAFDLNIAKDDPRYLFKQVKYSYKLGKLQKMKHFAPAAPTPYLTIELEYDEKPGYLQNLPLEAKFMPLELPYRSHNITRYTVKDREGNIRKDLSYTCSYDYNRDGYPTKIKRTMLDGQELEGYIVYKASTGKPEVAEASLGAEK